VVTKTICIKTCTDKNKQLFRNEETRVILNKTGHLGHNLNV
jgi:hypothetical protein